MAKATAICTCATCGVEFKKTATKPSRIEADRWVEWAVEFIDECSGCYAARKRVEQEQLVAQYNLPVIEGVSEKQIAYAQSLRTRYVADHTYKVDAVLKMMARRDNPDFCKKLEEKGVSFDEALKSRVAAKDCTAAYVCLTSASARDIIDVLK